ncbi:metallophosphoesterase [Bordetella sp. N]|uniref:metallophosphoesterase n=1 Tax=Bordetella sp. N TaxID=1746199 RepID=UPI0009E771DD|nr:metallophosphoesterase [Bordetella sp. N]
MYKHMPPNLDGRDFVVGDLHGCYDLLQNRLSEVAFDGSRDRLFSVGDLIDRGPDSLSCLRLLRQPWFFAVMGNHEKQMADYLLNGSAREAQRLRWMQIGGAWFEDISDAQRYEVVSQYLPLIRDLPYVITVGDGMEKFHVTHGQLCRVVDRGSLAHYQSVAEANVEVLLDSELCKETLEANANSILFGRHLLKGLRNAYVKRYPEPAGGLLTSADPWAAGLSLTFAGHTPTASVVLHQSHLFIDGGPLVYKNRGSLHLLNAAEVRQWISRAV